MIGDAGVPNTDLSYTGDVSNSPFSLDYYRQKASDFQALLNGLDTAYSGALDALSLNSLSQSDADAIGAMLDDFGSRREALKLTAEALNMGAGVINGLGGRMGQISIPGTLGFVQFAVPVAFLAAIATAVALITWGTAWIIGLNDRLKTAQLIDAQATPEDKAALSASIAKTEAAKSVATGGLSGGLQSFATIAKWGGVAFLAYLAWKSWNSRKR